MLFLHNSRLIEAAALVFYAYAAQITCISRKSSPADFSWWYEEIDWGFAFILLWML